MDLSALIVTIVGTVMFFGFAAWMAIYSRRTSESNQEPTESGEKQ